MPQKLPFCNLELRARKSGFLASSDLYRSSEDSSFGTSLLTSSQMERTGKENENTSRLSQCPRKVRVLQLVGTAELSILLLQPVSNGAAGQG